VLRDLFVKERNVITLSTTGLIISIGFQLWDPLLPVYLEEGLGASVTSIGVIYGLLAVPSMVSAFVGGYLSDRIGRKKVIIACDFLVAFLTFLLSLTSTLIEFSLLLLIQSLFIGASRSALRAMIAESSPDRKRGTAFSNFLFLSLIGQIIGPAIGGSLAGKLGFIVLFASSSFVLFIGTVFRLIFLREKMTYRKDIQESEQSIPHERRHLSFHGTETSTHYDEFNRSLLIYIMCLGMFGFADDLIDTFISIYSKNILYMSIEDVGLLFSVRHLAMFSFILPSGMLADKVGEKICIIISWILSPLALLAFAFSQGGILAFLTYFLDGVAWAIRQPAMPSLLASLTPRNRYGIVFGFSHLIRTGVGVPSPMLGGLMWEILGPISLFYVYLVIMALAALIVGFSVAPRTTDDKIYTNSI